MEEKKQPITPLQPLENAFEIQQAIEAILYAAGYPVRFDKLAEVLSLGVKDVKTMVKELAVKYNNENTPSGIQLLIYPTTCQLCTKEQFLPYIREALGIRRSGTLSNSSIEVLAVVAYNQPVTRAYIDAVRGVDSAYAVASLLERGLIHSIGRLDAPGRPMLYGTTDDFLRCFGLTSLTELPGVSTAEADELFERLKKKVNAFDAVSENQISIMDVMNEDGAATQEEPQE